MRQIDILIVSTVRVLSNVLIEKSISALFHVLGLNMFLNRYEICKLIFICTNENSTFIKKKSAMCINYDAFLSVCTRNKKQIHLYRIDSYFTKQFSGRNYGATKYCVSVQVIMSTGYTPKRFMKALNTSDPLHPPNRKTIYFSKISKVPKMPRAELRLLLRNFFRQFSSPQLPIKAVTVLGGKNGKNSGFITFEKTEAANECIMQYLGKTVGEFDSLRGIDVKWATNPKK